MDAREKAFIFASDIAKQLITLSTAILTLTVTFSKDIIRNTPTNIEAGLLMTAWIFHILSIFFGVWTLMALTGELEQLPIQNNETQISPEPSTRKFNVFLPALLQIGSFLLATILVIFFGVIIVLYRKQPIS
jgi:hypothetical protein